MDSDPVEDIRAASRQLVRELGFMGRGLAGTALAPSAVHALIEIGAGQGVTARDLARSLRLDKSSVSRMLQKLQAAGLIAGAASAGDGRLRALELTDAGRAQAAAIHGFARDQVAAALRRMPGAEVQRLRGALRGYAGALAGEAAPEPRILPGYRTGLIAAVTGLHAAHYARTAGFGQKFESVVAAGLAGFCDRLDRPCNAVWSVLQGDGIVGSIAIDGEDLGPGIAHLRWFILDAGTRGSGIGRRLLDGALRFADASGARETRLWTFAGLAAARHLYEAAGFHLIEERPGDQWGREVVEQCFVRPRG